MTPPTGRKGTPARIFYGGDDERREGTWECLLSGHEKNALTFNDVPTFEKALLSLAAHQRMYHSSLYRFWRAYRRLDKLF